MKTQHFFLCSPSVPAPDRWRQAFADGQALEAQTLLERLPSFSAVQSMIWLSVADSQWIDHLKKILQDQPAARVVLLSGAPEPDEGLRAIDAGARAYTHAYAVPALLQEVATVVEHGGLWVGPDLLHRLVGSTHAALAKLPPSATASNATATSAANNPWTLLSAREAQVARAVSAGRSNKEVADLMFISERTVKAHLGAVFEKLGVRDRLQLVLRLATHPDPGPSAAGEPLP